MVELLENQGWIKIYLENRTINKELVRKFFSTLILSGMDSSLVGMFTINGIEYILTHQELGKILSVSIAGSPNT